MISRLISKDLGASIGATLCLLGLVTGCDSTPTPTAYCASEHGVLCAPAGFPYVAAIGSRSDACPGGIADASCAKPLSKTTNIVSNPAPGKVCMKGTVAGREGFAWLIVQVDQWDKPYHHIVSVLDADALGIEGLRFTVDTPPTSGMTMFSTTAHQTQCFDGPPGCYTAWNLTTGPRSNNLEVIKEPGVVNAPFDNFSSDDPNQTFDSKRVGDFIFVLGARTTTTASPTSRFVDADGGEINPSGGDAGAADGGTADTATSDAATADTAAAETATSDGGTSDDGVRWRLTPCRPRTSDERVLEALPGRSLLFVALLLPAACSVDARSVTASRSACAGLPVEQEQITDFSDAAETTDVEGHPGITFTMGPLKQGGVSVSFAAQGLQPPRLSLISQGDNRALRIDASPGVPSVSRSYLGFGLGFGIDPELCVDASEFRGVRFTLDGSLGTCQLMFQVDISEDFSIEEDNSPLAACKVGVDLCYPPFSLPLTIDGPTHFEIPFTALSDGSPIPLVDQAITSISWKLWTLTSTRLRARASLVLDDVAFFR